MSNPQGLSRIEATVAVPAGSAELMDIEALYNLRRPEVMGFLVRFGVDIVEAEDIAQEVFLKACKPPYQKKAPDHLFSWLLTCARNLAINRYRRRKRELLAPTQAWREWEETLSDPKQDQVGTLEERERFERYRSELALLTPLEQQLVLFRGQGRTFREVAATLDMPLRSAIYVTSVAMQKLEERLQNL